MHTEPKISPLSELRPCLVGRVRWSLADRSGFSRPTLRAVCLDPFGFLWESLGVSSVQSAVEILQLFGVLRGVGKHAEATQDAQAHFALRCARLSLLMCGLSFALCRLVAERISYMCLRIQRVCACHTRT